MHQSVRNRPARLARGTGALAVLFCGGGASAQSGDPLVMPDLVVSASRTAVESREVGSAVTVITAEEIERRQVRLGSDLLRPVPGLAGNRTGTVGGLTQLSIRAAEGRGRAGGREK